MKYNKKTQTEARNYLSFNIGAPIYLICRRKTAKSVQVGVIAIDVFQEQGNFFVQHEEVTTYVARACGFALNRSHNGVIVTGTGFNKLQEVADRISAAIGREVEWSEL